MSRSWKWKIKACERGTDAEENLEHKEERKNNGSKWKELIGEAANVEPDESR